MGTVYRATDAIDKSTIALKVLSGPTDVDMPRFEREARVLARLSHPNIVRYVDHGYIDEGCYLAMEWLSGETLADRLARERIAVADAVASVRTAAAALGAAHAAGIVHRDVKPANLFLVGGMFDQVKVIDFGIARQLDARSLALTATGTIVGTPYYMAPEQARADAMVDARADVYSLGAVLYEALTGRRPFVNETLMAILAAILLEDPTDVREHAPEIPAALADLTMLLLAKSPDARPNHGAALVDAIDALGAMHASGSAKRTPPRAALTEREQRVLCLVLGAGRGVSHAKTLESDERDPMEHMRSVVEAQGGRLELLADFSFVVRVDPNGTPTEQAVRAARCASALRRVAPSIPLAAVAGRGMFRGPIPVGEVIERGSTLLGVARHARTIATRTLVAEDEGTLVRIDDVMAGLLASRYEIQKDEHSALLGKERRTASTMRTLLGRASPCFGRTRELSSLKSLYAECTEEGIARSVLVTGPAGGGKSRLIHELLDQLATSGESPTPEVWIARGDPMGAGSPFGLLAQLVSAAAGIVDGEPLELRREKILARLGRHVHDDALSAAAENLGSIARTPFERGRSSLPPDDPKLRGDAMREAFLTWLGAELRTQPLLIVLDDLQWGDRPSILFVDAALRELADRPLMVVASGRPETNEIFPDLFEERDAQLVRLGRLTPRASEQLLRHALGNDADGELVARLVERADGNPFFLEELVRALSEGHGDAALPTTVLGMVQARLAVLEPTTRRVLRAASVFGRRFWRDGIVELLGGTAQAGDIDSHLVVLAQRELVDRASEPRLTGQVEYSFRNALTREAAFAMLTDEDRRLGHRLAGEWLERAGERDALVLAEHFARGGDDPRAAEWLGRAAEQALEGDDLASAIERAERGLALADESARGRILVTLADAHRWRGEYKQAFERAHEAAEVLEPGTRSFFRALGVLFPAAGRIGRGDEAEGWRQKASRVEAYPNAVSSQVVALCRAATHPLVEGDRARFEATMQRAEHLAATGAENDPLARAWILALRASWALREGDHGAFVDGTEAAVAAYEAAGDTRDACNQRVRLGNGYVGLGDCQRAERVLREALASARRMGLPLIEGYAWQNLGHALLHAGALDEALDAQTHAIAIAKRISDPVLEAGSLLYCAEARERAGDADSAIADASAASDLLSGVPAFRTVAQAVLARATLAAGDHDRALRIAEQAASGLEEHALEEGEALVRLVHAESLAAAGRREDARALAREAVARLTQRAEKIADTRWREAFLHDVPTHARLLELASEG